MAGAERSEQSKETESYLQQFAGLRASRIDYDTKCQMVSDYILPRRDFTVTQRPNQLRPHRIVSSVGINANTRMAALVLAYIIDYTRPFLLPNVKRGLVAAGRDTDLDQFSLDYLGSLEWSVFDHMMLPKAQLMLRLGSILKEFCAFGNGVMWCGRRRGFGPYFNARPVQACWWSENEEGAIDTLYFKMRLPIYRVLNRWPAAQLYWSATKAGSNEPAYDENELTDIVLACRPRPEGKFGAVREAKPFAFVAISEEKGAILERSGYDSFPYAVFRYDPMPGNSYGEGPGTQVLPDVMVLNHIVECIEDAASQDALPPLAMPARMFAKVLDRRPGAVNLYNAAGLGMQRADNSILKLNFTGTLENAWKLKQELTSDIEIGYFTDWLRLRESGDMTAEEVNERRDMRLRGMSSIVANCELPMSVLGERSMDVMSVEGILPPGPPGIASVEVDWEYAGPLQIAQLRGNVQSALQIINARALVAKDDPAAAQAVDLEEALRVVAEGLGAPARVMNSRAKVAQERSRLAKQQQQQADAQKLALVAQAARDGGAGASSAVDAMNGAAPQGPQGAPGAPGAPPSPSGAPAAPFAPASPFATPVIA